MTELDICPDPDCGQVAEVIDRWFAMSSDGPVLHVATLCLHRHRYTTTEE